MSTLARQAQLAKTAAADLRTLPEKERNLILREFATRMISEQKQILRANVADCRAAEKDGMKPAMLDRLRLDEQRIAQMSRGVQQVASLPDPLHQILAERTLTSGLRLQKISMPFGVIAIIYESRPNVTADCAALCLKAGSSCLLKGGSEAYRTNAAIVKLLRAVLRHCHVDANAVQLAENPSHQEVLQFLENRSSADLLIPRGSAGLIRHVIEHSRIPVIETGAGICHVYVDKGADLAMAERIVINAKTSRPAVCNAMETLLVHQAAAPAFLPRIAAALQKKHVLLYGDSAARKFIPDARPATAQNYATEYDDLIMNIRVVRSLAEAIAHIQKYSTHHSECIVSRNRTNVKKFMDQIDSACLYHNASTRFTDGFEFGLGAEIGISTQKLHARGPMGLQELTTYAYHLEGDGQIR